jgi:hypothetical protein
MIGIFVATDRGIGMVIANYGWHVQIRLLAGATIIRHEYRIVGRKPG